MARGYPLMLTWCWTCSLCGRQAQRSEHLMIGMLMGGKENSICDESHLPPLWRFDRDHVYCPHHEIVLIIDGKEQWRKPPYTQADVESYNNPYHRWESSASQSQP